MNYPDGMCLYSVDVMDIPQSPTLMQQAYIYVTLWRIDVNHNKEAVLRARIHQFVTTLEHTQRLFMNSSPGFTDSLFLFKDTGEQ